MAHPAGAVTNAGSGELGSPELSADALAQARRAGRGDG